MTTLDSLESMAPIKEASTKSPRRTGSAISVQVLAFLCLAVGVLVTVSQGMPQPNQSANMTVTSDPSNRTEQLGRSLSALGESNNNSRLSSRVLLFLKLLQFMQNYASQNGANSSASESRSMSSWLHFRRPVQRQENQFFIDRSLMPNANFPRNGPSRQPLFPPMPPTNSFIPKPHDPNSLFFMPTLGDTNGVDYWLKFIEEANLEDRPLRPMLPKMREKSLHRLKPMPAYKRVKANRYRSKGRPSERKASKGRVPSEPEEVPVYPMANEEFDGDSGAHEGELSDAKSTGSNKVLKQVAEYDTSPRCDKFTDEICIDDFEYPEHAILDEIFKRKDIFQLMYSEVKGETPMVDGMARDEEENFSQDYYYNNNEPDTDDYDGYPAGNNRTEYNDFLEAQEPDKAEPEKKKPSGGFVCRSEVLYAKPKLARNIKGKWRVIVNAGEFTQTVRLEKCNKPNSECRFIADNKYDSRCAQISAIHRLLVFEKGKGFYIDTFQVPTACTCHVHTAKNGQSKYNSQYPGESSSSISTNVKRDKSKSKLGETLWSLLGTEPEKSKRYPSSGDDRNGNFALFPEQSSDQKLNAELLRLLPQLTSLAPENVLQQLLEEYGEANSPALLPAKTPKGYGHRVSSSQSQASKVPKSDLQKFLQLANSHSRHSAREEQKRVAEASSLSFPRPTTTTIVNSNGGALASPVVQVIHVPVSTEQLVASDMDGLSTEGDSRFTSRNRFRPIHRPIHHLSNPKHAKYLISTSSNYLQSQSKTNSSVAPPPLANGTDVTKYLEQQGAIIKSVAASGQETQEQQETSKDNKQMVDKKVNFSYHPILDYIN